MTDLETYRNIRDFIANQAANGDNIAIRDRASELLQVFDELIFSKFETTYASANAGEKLILLGRLQSALLSGSIRANSSSGLDLGSDFPGAGSGRK